MIALSEILVRDFRGEVPADRNGPTTLSGGGRKTATVVMNCTFGAAKLSGPFRVAARHWVILRAVATVTRRSGPNAGDPVADLCRFRNEELLQGSTSKRAARGKPRP